jgi:hypothetical protein
VLNGVSWMMINETYEPACDSLSGYHQLNCFHNTALSYFGFNFKPCVSFYKSNCIPIIISFHAAKFTPSLQKGYCLITLDIAGVDCMIKMISLAFPHSHF